jgi:Flp pilus assembly protein TadG
MRSLPRYVQRLPRVPGRRKRWQRGNAIIEFSLLAPWVLFLFVGVFDMGFYTTAMIGVENAARVAAEYTSQSTLTASDATTACNLAQAEMALLPNVHSQPNCNAGGGNTVVVTAAAGPGPDALPATTVTVTYTGGQLIPIPGLLMGQLNLTRSVVMRVKP